MADITRHPANRNNNDGERIMSRLNTVIGRNPRRQSRNSPSSPLSPDFLMEAMCFFDETFLVLELVSQNGGEKKDQSQSETEHPSEKSEQVPSVQVNAHCSTEALEETECACAAADPPRRSDPEESSDIPTQGTDGNTETRCASCNDQNTCIYCRRHTQACHQHLITPNNSQHGNNMEESIDGAVDCLTLNLPRNNMREEGALNVGTSRLTGREENKENHGQQNGDGMQRGRCPTYNPSLEAYPYTPHILPGHATKALPMLHNSEAPPPYNQVDIENQHSCQLQAASSSDPVSSVCVLNREPDQPVLWTSGHPSARPTEKPRTYSVVMAYSLCTFLGIFGAHHLYLGRRNMALLYACTFGLCGIGWAVDMVRLSSLVADQNRKEFENHSRGYILTASPYGELREISLVEAFVWCLPPSGLFGGLHYALGRRRIYAAIYSATFGCFGLGWIVDLVRLPFLLRRRNLEVQRFIDGEALPDNPSEEVNLEDAYLLCALLGFLGAHHVYLRQPWLFILYFFTFGLAGIGWMIDLARMPTLLARRKAELRQGTNPLHLDTAYVLLCTFGFLGFHHFYLRRIRSGILYLLTCGLFGFGCYFDHYRMQELVKEANASRRLNPDPNVYRRHLVPFRVPLDNAGRPDWEGRTVWLSDPVQARRYRMQHGLHTGSDVTRMQIGPRTRDEDIVAVFVPPEEELPSIPQPPQIHDNRNPPPTYRDHLFHERLPTEIVTNTDMSNI